MAEEGLGVTLEGPLAFGDRLIVLQSMVRDEGSNAVRNRRERIEVASESRRFDSLTLPADRAQQPGMKAVRQCISRIEVVRVQKTGFCSGPVPIEQLHGGKGRPRFGELRREI